MGWSISTIIAILVAVGSIKAISSRSGLIDSFKDDLPDVTGKVFVITGTTSGTGFAAAQVAAEKGGEVVLLNRPSHRSRESLEQLRAAVPSAKFVPIDCDLRDFASVRAAAAKVRARYDKLYCLSNNAGIMAAPDLATKDGYDIQMQTNHLSHFLLTGELFPLLVEGSRAYGDARIVQHSSMSRDESSGGLQKAYLGPNGGDLGGDSPGMSGAPRFRYSQSKLANSVFSQALHERLQSRGEELKNIRAIAAHPGAARTNLGRYIENRLSLTTKALFFVVGLFAQSSTDGSMGLLKGMMDPDAKSGELYGPEGMKGYPIAHRPRAYEVDSKAKEMLWHSSEEATGVKFEI